jgi:pimeloyl-ACP methyl ester carboxylesterase
MPESIRTRDGRTLAYAEWGDPGGAPLFSLHGTPGCRLNRPQEEHKLRDAGIRLITYDRPGYGASDRRAGRTVADCEEDVEALADALGIERFPVVGGSGGGPHALAVGARLARRVTRVRCSVSPAPYGAEGLDWFGDMDPGNVKEFGWALEGEDVLVRELEREAAEVQERVARDPTLLLEGFDLAEPDRATLADPRVQEVVRESTAEMFANGIYGWVDDDLAFARPWGFDLDEITVPVEVRYGAADVLAPAAHGAWLAAHIPGAVANVETDRGHLPDPDTVIDDLSDFAHAG